MLRVLVLLALLAAGAFGAPLVMENADTACAALQHRLGSLAGLPAGAPPPGGSHGPVTVAGGRLAEAMARRQNPAIPPVASCTLMYWLTLVPMAKAALHAP